MAKYLRYLRYVLRHKWYVMLECFRLGLYWRGITHDLSKFRPSEWFPYANYFYGGEKTLEKEYQFEIAWLLHQKRNPHHWQYWVLHEDSGATKTLTVPPQYLGEMIADWRGMKRTFGKPTSDSRQWYMDNKDKIMLNGDSRTILEWFLRNDAVRAERLCPYGSRIPVKITEL